MGSSYNMRGSRSIGNLGTDVSTHHRERYVNIGALKYDLSYLGEHRLSFLEQKVPLTEESGDKAVKKEVGIVAM